jgi:hypothetical protein
MAEDYEVGRVRSDLDELSTVLTGASEGTGLFAHALRAAPDTLHAPFAAAAGSVATQIEPARRDIDAALTGIPTAGGPAERSGLALRALTAVGYLEAGVNDVVASGALPASPPAPGQPAGALGAFIGKLKSILGKIQAGILSFLSKYMDVESWSISGELTGGLPWLGGAATLTLTFGS